VRLHSVLERIFVVDISVEDAVTNCLEQVTGGPFEIRTFGDIVHDRRSGNEQRATAAQVFELW